MSDRGLVEIAERTIKKYRLPSEDPIDVAKDVMYSMCSWARKEDIDRAINIAVKNHKGSSLFAATDKEGKKGVWRTSKKGTHYFIRDGETPEKALKRKLGEIKKNVFERKKADKKLIDTEEHGKITRKEEERMRKRRPSITIDYPIDEDGNAKTDTPVELKDRSVLHPVRTTLSIWKSLPSELKQGITKFSITDSPREKWYGAYSQELGILQINVPKVIKEKDIDAYYGIQRTLTHELAHNMYTNASILERAKYALSSVKRLLDPDHKGVTSYSRETYGGLVTESMDRARLLSVNKRHDVADEIAKYIIAALEHRVKMLESGKKEKVQMQFFTDYYEDQIAAYTTNTDKSFKDAERRSLLLDSQRALGDRIYLYAVERHAETISNYLAPAYTPNMLDIRDYRDSLDDIKNIFGDWPVFEKARLKMSGLTKEQVEPKAKAGKEETKPVIWPQYHFKDHRLVKITYHVEKPDELIVQE